jgi:hypothetical protein
LLSEPYQKSYEHKQPFGDIEEGQTMVYCSKCGTLNPYDAIICSKCSEPLHPAAGQEAYGPYWRHRHYRDEYHARRGSGWGALFVGIIIIVVGLTLLLSQIYGILINWSAWWAVVIIFVGLWLIFTAFRRSRRYRPPQA